MRPSIFMGMLPDYILLLFIPIGAQYLISRLYYYILDYYMPLHKKEYIIKKNKILLQIPWYRMCIIIPLMEESVFTLSNVITTNAYFSNNTILFIMVYAFLCSLYRPKWIKQTIINFMLIILWIVFWEENNFVFLLEICTGINFALLHAPDQKYFSKISSLILHMPYYFINIIIAKYIFQNIDPVFGLLFTLFSHIINNILFTLFTCINNNILYCLNSVTTRHWLYQKL